MNIPPAVASRVQGRSLPAAPVKRRTRFAALPVAAGVLVFVSFLSVSPVLPAAAAVGREPAVRGRIILRRGEERPLAHHPVALEVFRRGVLTGRKEGETDAAGRFLFAPVRGRSTLAYQVSTSYEDVLYRSAPFAVPEKGTVPPVRLEVFEATAQEPELLVERQHVVVRSESDGGVAVSEMIILVNPTEKTYWNPSSGLKLPLPAEARNVSLQRDGRGTALKTPGEFLTREPVRPGKTPLVWSYDLPSGLTGVKFREAVVFPTVRLRLFVEGYKFTVRSSDLVAGPPLSLRGVTYQSFEGKDLLPGRTVTVKFRRRDLIRRVLLWGGLGMGFAGLLGLGFLLASKGRPGAEKGEEGCGLRAGEPGAEPFSEEG